MFRITDYTKATPVRMLTNNVSDIRDIVIGITGRESDGAKAEMVAGDMGFGGIYTDIWYRIECERTF